MREKVVILFIFLGFAALNSQNSIPFIIKNDLILVQARIGSEKGYFILDNGASDLLLNTKNKSVNSSHTFGTLGEDFAAEQIAGENIRIGASQYKTSAFYLTDLSQIEAFINQPLQGIIPLKIFNSKYIVIDFENQWIHVNYPKRHRSATAYHTYRIHTEAHHQILTIPHGKSWLKFILDSGATTHLISDRSVKEYNLAHQEIGKKDILTFQSKKESSKLIQADHILPTETLFVITDFTKVNEQKKQRIDGILSLCRLQAEMVIIDSQENQIHIKW